jgi:hypothetical protein
LRGWANARAAVVVDAGGGTDESGERTTKFFVCWLRSFRFNFLPKNTLDLSDIVRCLVGFSWIIFAMGGFLSFLVDVSKMAFPSKWPSGHCQHFSARSFNLAFGIIWGGLRKIVD